MRVRVRVRARARVRVGVRVWPHPARCCRPRSLSSCATTASTASVCVGESRAAVRVRVNLGR